MRGKPITVGITGGIGSGKSTVSRALRVMGFHVYDCDFEARRITDNSPEVRDALAERYGAKVYTEAGCLDRKALADIVFADKNELVWLNSLIHRLVCEDIERNFLTTDAGVLFIESAIMCGSGLDRLTDYIWNVDAPKAIRVERVKKRSGLTEEQIFARIDAQTEEVKMLREWGSAHPGCYFDIDNSGESQLLNQITELINNLTQNIHA